MHYSDIAASGFRTLKQGARISFEADRHGQAGRIRNVVPPDG